MNFNYNIKVDDPVDSNMHQAFSGLLESTQATFSRIAAEQNRWKTRHDDVSNENAALREENAKLKAEVARLKTLQKTTPPTGGGTMGGHFGGTGGTMTGMGRTFEPSAEKENDPFELERTIKIHDAPVHSVAMGPDNDMVATASWDASVKLYNLVNDDVVRTLGPCDGGQHMGGLYAAAFAKNDRGILGCTSCDKFVYLWNYHSGELLKKLTGHNDEVNGIDFHYAQQVMCTAADDCKVIIWDYQEGLTLRTLAGHKKAVYGATFFDQEYQYCVATCCFDTMTRIFDMRDKRVIATLEHHNDDVIGIDYCSSKQCLATGSDDGLICLWDPRSWKLQRTINTKNAQGTDEAKNEVKRVAFSPDGNDLAAACSSGRVFVYDMNDYHLKADLGGHQDCVFDVTWGVCKNTKSKILVSASHDKTNKYWRERP